MHSKGFREPFRLHRTCAPLGNRDRGLNVDSNDNNHHVETNEGAMTSTTGDRLTEPSRRRPGRSRTSGIKAGRLQPEFGNCTLLQALLSHVPETRKETTISETNSLFRTLSPLRQRQESNGVDTQHSKRGGLQPSIDLQGASTLPHASQGTDRRK